jgi:hypothetical protein
MMFKLKLAGVALLVAVLVQPALASELRGDAFVTALNGNTLTATTPSGKPVHLYFLPGGRASYQEASGTAHAGFWHLTHTGNVCVTWAPGASLGNGCLGLAQSGKITWSSFRGLHLGGLTGGVNTLGVSERN